MPFKSVAASATLPPGQIQRPELNSTISCNGTPTSGWPWQFFKKTRIVIPAPANVSPRDGPIVIRFFAGLVNVTVQYDESGQTMSADAIEPILAMASAARAMTIAERNMARPP